MRPAIRVESLAKQYRIGTAKRPPDRQLREVISEGVKGLWGRVRGRRNEREAESDGTFWALQGVSFEVQPGEVVGIIGRNGAGKSTLLKILSRIVEPTSGRAEIRGRMGSLLEVGTGFHPELTGRENIYLNGSILGMSRRTIAQKFDEIVAFSEIESFLDTPVKRYSSGMYVRLAFAVAAHLDPEILIVDEVLAVGDASFQQRCLGKMSDVARTGRTVLFVSHNMQAVTQLCSRALMLNQGRVVCEDHPLTVVEKYLESKVNQSAAVSWDLEAAPGDENARLRSVRVLNHRGEATIDQDITRPISIEMEVSVLKPALVMEASVHVLNAQGLCLFAVGAVFNGEADRGPTAPGTYRATCRIPAHFLNDGRHYVSAFVVRNSRDIVVVAQEVAGFHANDYGTGRAETGWLGKVIGAVRPRFQWDIEHIGGA
jgi:lipopolysaccharide transport system ATP-binding protein